MTEKCKPKLFGLLDGHKWKPLRKTMPKIFAEIASDIPPPMWNEYEECSKCGAKSVLHLTFDGIGSYRELLSKEDFENRIKNVIPSFGEKCK